MATSATTPPKGVGEISTTGSAVAVAVVNAIWHATGSRGFRIEDSVTASAVGRPGDVHACADRIVIRQDGRIVAEHPRAFGRKRLMYELTA